MGLFGSKSSKDEKQSTATTNQGSTTVTLPSYLQGPAETYGNDLTNAFNLYGTPDLAKSLVPDANDLQKSAFTAAGNLGTGAGADYFGNAATQLNQLYTSGPSVVGPISSQGYGSASLLDGLQNYYNPYQSQVIDTTLAGLDKQNGADTAQLQGQGAKNAAFGGSRFGLAMSNLADLQAQTKASTQAGLQKEGFDTATALSDKDAARRQQAAADAAAAANAAASEQAQLQAQADQANNAQKLAATNALAALATSYGQNQIANVNTQLAAGDDQRSIDTDTANSYLSMLGKMQQLLGMNGSDLRGTDTDSSGTSNGKSSSTSTTIGFS